MMTVRRRKLARRGGTIILVIAFFAIAMALAGGWVQTALNQQRHMKLWQEKTQVNWLADAGIRRALARRAADDTYQGEIWNLSPDDLDRRDAAKVIIRLETLASDDDTQPKLQVTAIATYPAGLTKRVQTTQTARIPMNTPTLETGETP